MIFRAVEDPDLIGRARRGDVEAYNLLISRWEKRVYNYLLRITGEREEALDLSQEVFLKAYQHLRKLEDPARFAPWLFRIAHNEAFSSFRKRKVESDVLAVTTALTRLTEEQWETLVLKIYQGFKFEEIAEILSCPVSTVKSRLYAGLDALKAQLAPLKTRGVS